MTSDVPMAHESRACIHCKGTMHEGTEPFSVDRNGYHIHWDALPAWVCGQCGEALSDHAEVDRIHRALTALDASQATAAA